MNKSIHLKKISTLTDELSARMYTFPKLLTKDEQFFFQDYFLKHPKETETTILKFCSLITEELLTLKLIKNDEKEKKIQELYTEKLAFFEKNYTK